jgi:hypothetical protein
MLQTKNVALLERCAQYEQELAEVYKFGGTKRSHSLDDLRQAGFENRRIVLARPRTHKSGIVRRPLAAANDVRVAPEAQAIFCRRRHQPRRPTPHGELRGPELRCFCQHVER